ncbi:MAG: hypothetical protein AAFZ15_34940, partial [Bacteroidota bacterium]
MNALHSVVVHTFITNEVTNSFRHVVNAIWAKKSAPVRLCLPLQRIEKNPFADIGTDRLTVETGRLVDHDVWLIFSLQTEDYLSC